jgi:hypothetical protein
LCSANEITASTGMPSTKGRATPEMLTVCHEYLREHLSILDPTVVVLQGDKANKAFRSAFKIDLPLEQVVPVDIGGSRRSLVVALSHPTSHPSGPGKRNTNWRSRNTEYFRKTIEPIVAELRAKLL